MKCPFVRLTLAIAVVSVGALAAPSKAGASVAPPPAPPMQEAKRPSPASSRPSEGRKEPVVVRPVPRPQMPDHAASASLPKK